MDDARKNKRPARKNADGEGAARGRGKKSAKRFLAKVKAPPPQGCPATAPGSPPPDERKPGAREHGIAGCHRGSRAEPRRRRRTLDESVGKRLRCRLTRSSLGRAGHVLGLAFASGRSHLVELIFAHRLVHAPRCTFERTHFALASLCGQRRACGLLLSARFGWHVSLFPT